MRTLTLGSSLALATMLTLTAHPVQADILPASPDLILKIDDDGRWHQPSHHRRWIGDDDDNRRGWRDQRFYRHGDDDDDDDDD